MLAGIIIGSLIRASFDGNGDLVFMLFDIAFSINELLFNGLFFAIGQIFIASLKMLVVPLVFVSLVCGVNGLSDPAKLGRMGGKSVLLYIATAGIAISTAIRDYWRRDYFKFI